VALTDKQAIKLSKSVTLLPSPISNGTTIRVGVDADMSGFEGAFQEVWEEMVRRAMVGATSILVAATSTTMRHQT